MFRKESFERQKFSGDQFKKKKKFVTYFCVFQIQRREGTVYRINFIEHACISNIKLVELTHLVRSNSLRRSYKTRSATSLSYRLLIYNR